MLKLNLSEIINTVGGNRRKLITLIVLLVFMTIFYLSKDLIFKSDCSELIAQNENILKNNIKTMAINNKVLNKNSILTEKLYNLEDSLEEKNKKIRSLKNRTARLENLQKVYSEKNIAINNRSVRRRNDSVENNDIDSIIVFEPIIEINRSIISSPRRIRNMDTSDSTSILDSLYEDDENNENDSISIEEPKKIGFFKRLFGIKKKSDEILDSLDLN